MDNLKEAFNLYCQEFKKCLEGLSKKEERVKHIPNALTLSRSLAPIINILIIILSGFAPALIVSSLFALTDLFDGVLARKLKSVSDFGKDLDAICDKMFYIGIALPLIPSFPIILVPIAFEGIIMGVNTHSKAKGHTPRTTKLGKIKANVLPIFIVLLYLSKVIVIDPAIIISLFSLNTTLQVTSAIQYTYIHLKKEKVKKYNLIRINAPDNPEVEEIKKRMTSKRKGLKINQGKSLNKQDPSLTYTKTDYEELKNKVTGGESAEIGSKCLTFKPTTKIRKNDEI